MWWNVHSVRGFVLCVRQALMGNQITVYGEGKQTRSFCYVSDLVDGLMRLMNGDYIGPVNLGTRTPLHQPGRGWALALFRLVGSIGLRKQTTSSPSLSSLQRKPE